YLLPTQSAEGQRLYPARGAFASFCAARKPYLEWTPVVPEPVMSRRRNQGNLLSPECGVQIDSPNFLEEPLFQEPFLHPHKCCVVVFYCDHHGGLLHQPGLDRLRHREEVDTQTADDHQH